MLHKARVTASCQVAYLASEAEDENEERIADKVGKDAVSAS